MPSEGAGQDSRRFEGRVAVVTGAGQGIGEAYARSLAAEGAAVIVAERNESQGRRVVRAIESDGGVARFVPCDVSDEQSCLAMGEAAIEAFGGVDCLVNNAAIYQGMRMESMLTVPLDYWERFMAVNMTGALLATRAVYQSMVERGGGAIVNQSSTAAWMGAGYYGIAKLALHGLTHSLARELGSKNIRVNAIAPGPTDTEATRQNVPEDLREMLLAQMPLSRMGTPNDLVGALLFLLSDDAAWITGQILSVDGGQVLRP